MSIRLADKWEHPWGVWSLEEQPTAWAAIMGLPGGLFECMRLFGFATAYPQDGKAAFCWRRSRRKNVLQTDVYAEKRTKDANDFIGAGAEK